MRRFLLIIILTVNSVPAMCQAEFGFFKGLRTPGTLPVLVIDRPLVDLGQVEAGKTLYIDITVSNKGEASLVISDIFTGHGCFLHQRPSKQIKENESSVVRVRIVPSGQGSFCHKIVLTANVEGGTREILIRGLVI